MKLYPEAVKRTFANHYLKWGVLLNDVVIDAKNCPVIHKSAWEIKFVEGKDEKGNYYEFYATHREKHDQHFIIYENGDEVTLDALTEGFDYNPSLAGNHDAQKELFFESNRKIYEHLKNVGLL
jgi:hypothetical protein